MTTASVSTNMRPAVAGRIVFAVALSIAGHVLILFAASGSARGGIAPPARQTAIISAILHEPDAPGKVWFDASAEAAKRPVPYPSSEEPSGVPSQLPVSETTESVGIREAILPIGKADRYYTAAELDVKPLITTRTTPEYPDVLPVTSGTTRFEARIFIDERGHVEKVIVQNHDSTGAFAEAVIRAFSAARYTPGIKDGKPVKSLMILEISFDADVAQDGFRSNRY